MHVGDSEHVVNNTACPIALTQIAQSPRIILVCNLVGSYIGVHLTSTDLLTLCEVFDYFGTC